MKDRKVEKKKGSFFLPDEVVERDKHGQICGTIVAMGELAFTKGNPRKGDLFRLEAAPEVGDTIIFDKYSGGSFWIDTDEGECRMIADDDVIAVVEEADD